MTFVLVFMLVLVALAGLAYWCLLVMNGRQSDANDAMQRDYDERYARAERFEQQRGA